MTTMRSPSILPILLSCLLLLFHHYEVLLTSGAFRPMPPIVSYSTRTTKRPHLIHPTFPSHSRHVYKSSSYPEETQDDFPPIPQLPKKTRRTTIRGDPASSQKTSRIHNLPSSRMESQHVGRNIFQPYFPFPLDTWQVEAGGYIHAGCNVIVCAPTGAGKTVVGTMALHAALDKRNPPSLLDQRAEEKEEEEEEEEEKKKKERESFLYTSSTGTAIYTTPLKALSNQKFVELKQIFGSKHVGLSTGDMCINRGAKITVMTTEVYRNICWKIHHENLDDNPNDTQNQGHDDEDTFLSTLPELESESWFSSSLPSSSSSLSSPSSNSRSIVVLDEFHYMGQPGRGKVWEECVITSPLQTQIVGLSATLPNAYQLSQWMERVTHRPTILVDASGGRPVPLRYLYATSQGIFPLFRDADAGPGSPKGLLGLRGDYGGEGKKEIASSNTDSYGDDDETLSSPSKKKEKKKGFAKREESQENGKGDRDREYFPSQDKLPKGLQINPTLKVMEQRRREKIDRIIARRNLQYTLEGKRNRYEDTDQEDRRRYSSSYSIRRDAKPMTAKEERRERDRLLRQEMRKDVPSIFFLVQKLQQMKLLPAIFFIFSRVGCDAAAQSVCDAMLRQSTARITKEGDDAKVRQSYSKNYGVKDVGPEIYQDEDLYSAPMDQTEVQTRNLKEDDRIDDPFIQASLNKGDPLGKTRQRGRGREERRNENVIKDDKGRSFRISGNYVSEDTMASILDGSEASSYEDYDSKSTESVELSKYTQYGLLSMKEVKEVIARVRSFNSNNPEIRFDDETIDRFLYGVGSHHAGQLPAHKAFVEVLFRLQLMKVVFATETLAAGINMPARTTIICAMAKRGDDSNVNLLETSNLLQMAGRAGRRGMDTDGTCIIVATPFEGPFEAINILTSEIKPIVSQFSPSYSLAVNLIVRGLGKLDVARTLIQKSFAYFEKQQSEETIESAREAHGTNFEQVIESASHDYFLEVLRTSLESSLEDWSVRKSKIENERVFKVLNDKALLKKESKSFVDLSRIFDLEENTLRFLTTELENKKKESVKSTNFSEFDDGVCNMLDRDIDTQKNRMMKTKQELLDHVFTDIATIVNRFMQDPGKASDSLKIALNLARKGNDDIDPASPLSPLELTSYVKSAISSNRTRRKQNSLGKGLGIDQATLIDSIGNIASFQDDAWEEMLSLTKVLKAYGCLISDEFGVDDEKSLFRLSVAGEHIRLLGFENSLWCMVALGGAWDITGLSGTLDGTISTDESENVVIPQPQQEAATLISQLRKLDPSEMAGYVSCLVSDGTRGGTSSVVSSFQSLSLNQQRVIQSALFSMERLVEVQRICEVDEVSGKVQLELNNCEVVTAWAAGCSWSEALELSGTSPGDLVRSLHRALDALRQIGSLPYNPARSLSDVQICSTGIHPDIRRLCREAARSMDRYPVKDPLPSIDEDGVTGSSDDLEIPEGVKYNDE